MSSTPSTKSLGVFRGEGDSYVDLLIASCSQAKRASLEAPFDASLIGRPLQPYDFGSDELPAPASTGKQHTGSKRKGSPPKAASSGSPTRGQRGSPDQQPKQQPNNNKPAQPIQINSTSPGTAGKNKSAKLASSPLSSSPSSSGNFACPGMFSSPKPEMLPMPSPAALMRAANAMPVSPQLLVAAV